jgi:integrase
MPRKRTGALEFRDGRYIVKLTVNVVGGGTERRSFRLPEGTTAADAKKRRDRLVAKAASRVFERSEPLERTGDETLWEDFVETWLKSRIARGLRSVRKDRQRLKTHVTPILLGKPMVSITPADLRTVVSSLDRRIHDDEVQFGWLTASKTWGAVKKLFRDASRSKEPTLRVLPINPCDGVEGPDRGASKSSQWLYPREFEQLIACTEVPLQWRRVYAVTVYLYLRFGELRALESSDIDLEHDMAHVHRSMDEHGRLAREHTKTDSVRNFRIEANLLPVLREITAEQPGRLFDGVFSNAAAELRDHLWRAGVRRSALHVRTETSLPIRFHDLRATGITWAALRGDAAIQIRDRAGHTDLEQTNDYMRRAAGSGDIGEPFPSLGPLVNNVPRIVPVSSGRNDLSAKMPRTDIVTGALTPLEGPQQATFDGKSADAGDPDRPPPAPRDNSRDDSNYALESTGRRPYDTSVWALALAAESVGRRRIVVGPPVPVKGARRRQGGRRVG